MNFKEIKYNDEIALNEDNLNFFISKIDYLKNKGIYDSEIYMIKEIVLWFDYERVHKTMNTLDWKWFQGFDFKIPSKLKIMEESLEKLINLIIYGYRKKSDYITSSGGFTTRYIYSDKFYHNLELSFILSSSETYNLENDKKFLKLIKKDKRIKKIKILLK